MIIVDRELSPAALRQLDAVENRRGTDARNNLERATRAMQDHVIGDECVECLAFGMAGVVGVALGIQPCAVGQVHFAAARAAAQGLS